MYSNDAGAALLVKLTFGGFTRGLGGRWWPRKTCLNVLAVLRVKIFRLWRIFLHINRPIYLLFLATLKWSEFFWNYGHFLSWQICNTRKTLVDLFWQQIFLHFDLETNTIAAAIFGHFFTKPTSLFWLSWPHMFEIKIIFITLCSKSTHYLIT